MALHTNRLTTTTQTAFGGRKRTGIQPIGIQPIKRPIGRGRRSVPPISISGGLGGARLPNVRTSNIRGQLGALKRV